MLNLTAAGLTETEAKCYEALLAQKEWKPADLAKYVKETRTNCYKLLDNLVSKGLAERFDKAKKLHYRAANPTRLLELAREKRADQERADQALELHSRQLIETYYKAHEQPGVRFYQGKDAIKGIFEDMLSAESDIYFVRSPSDIKFYDEPFFEAFKKKRARKGIKTHALTPDTASANHDPAIDKANNFLRTWLPASVYSGSVEWNIYGDNLAIISYGEEATGMIIESPQIADSFRQLFAALQTSYSGSA